MRDPLASDAFGEIGPGCSTSQIGKFQAEVRAAHDQLTREDPKLVAWAREMEDRLQADYERKASDAPPMDRLDRVLLIHTAASPGWVPTQDIDPLFRPVVRWRVLQHRRAGNFLAFWPTKVIVVADWERRIQRVGWRISPLDRAVLNLLIDLTAKESLPTLAAVRRLRWRRKISKDRLEQGIREMRRLGLVHRHYGVLLTPIGQRIVEDVYDRTPRPQWWDGTHTPEEQPDGPPD